MCLYFHADKFRKGKRDGTPDKPSTPNASQDAMQEEGVAAREKKHVIVDDDILAMQIKPQDLEKVSLVLNCCVSECVQYSLIISLCETIINLSR